MLIMISQTFAKLYQKLNVSQKKAVNTVEGAVMVIAGPGTGKTQILTLRIANILDTTQMNPENILALTFTESAVFEMRSRLIDIIGRAAYSVEIHTFHGFCNKIIQKYSEEFEHLLSAENITDLEQIQIIEEILDSNKFEYLTPIYNKTLYIKPIQSAIGDLKKEGITPDIFARGIQQEEKDFEQIPDLLNDKGSSKGKMKGKYIALKKSIEKCKELGTVFKLYQDALLSKRLYDFNDMLLEVVKMLQKKPELLQQLQEQYQYILVDEHQDTNKAQNTIVELIGSYFENPNIFVVGDQKQAIFRFQGASIENFLYFKKLYPQAVLIYLEENYRSSQTILDAAGSLIKHNIQSKESALQEIPLTARAGHPPLHVQIAEYNDYFTEYAFIADDIKMKLEKGTLPEEIAIIARNNRDLVPLTLFLDRLQLSYSVDNDQNILQDPEIEKLFLILRTIQLYGSDEWLVRTMHLNFFGLHPLDIYTLVAFSRKQKQSLYDCIAQKTYLENITLLNEEAIQAFFTLLSSWKTLSENTTFDDVFVEIINTSGFLQSILGKARSLEYLDRVTTLYQDIRFQIFRNHHFNLKNFLDYIDLLNEHKLSLKSKTKQAHPHSVRLMTAHKSKGLEFEYVYIVNCYDTHWGNPSKKRTLFKIPWHQFELATNTEEVDVNEDERRLFYVALTRAKKSVMLSYATHGLDGKEQYPSQFIGEIEAQWQKKTPVEVFENEFLQHKEVILQKITPAAGEKDNVFAANKEYFAALFRRQGLSVSGLNNYLECPWKYFFRNLLRLPETKNNSQLYGTAIHEALNRYILAYSKKNSTLNTLISAYNMAVDKQPFTDTDREIFREKGLTSLEGYYNHALSTWTTPRMSELDIKGVELVEDIFLTGKIDMLEQIGKNDVIVYDFKTGKPKSVNVIEGKTADKKERGNYKRQLVFYKLLLDNYLNKRYTMNTGVIEFVEPSDSGSYKAEPFEITTLEIAELTQTIKDMAVDVMTLGFWDKTCDAPDCEYCRLKSYVVGA